jgi:hypothetical protein
MAPAQCTAASHSSGQETQAMRHEAASRSIAVVAPIAAVAGASLRDKFVQVSE